MNAMHGATIAARNSRSRYSVRHVRTHKAVNETTDVHDLVVTEQFE
ncbi:MAG: hypothetical protein ACJ8KO_13920 [Sulfurifustaceae bacterium]